MLPERSEIDDEVLVRRLPTEILSLTAIARLCMLFGMGDVMTLCLRPVGGLDGGEVVEVE